MKVVIVGAVAGGASAAARARRLNESAQIVLIERGQTASFANCGMPYHLSGEIAKRESLLVTPAARFAAWYNIDLRINTSVEKIDRAAKLIHCKNTKTGEITTESYDKLVLSPGASPIITPQLAALGPLLGSRVFTLRTLEDMDGINAAISRENPKSFVVLGGGYVGIEMADAIHRRGFEVTVIERNEQILGPFDKEMTVPILNHLRSKGVNVITCACCDSICPKGADGTGPLVFSLSSSVKCSCAGESQSWSVEADVCIASVGVCPESDLAASCGLEIGSRKGIRTNQHMQTNDPDIYAVGDAVEVVDFVTKEIVHIPLAGPANRQGRVAASHMMGHTGPDAQFRGTQGTSILRVFDMAIGSTGASEKTLKRLSIPYRKAYVHGSSHASYFPGAQRLHIKILFTPDTGKILGAQVVGSYDGGVDKRVDVFATAIQGGLTVYDLEEAELAYAPQFGSAKDPINMTGFVAGGVLRADQLDMYIDDATLHTPSTLVIDVRTPGEFAEDRLENSVNVPLHELRSKIEEVRGIVAKATAEKKTVAVMCKAGFRGYMARLILKQNGMDLPNLSGGFELLTRCKEQA